MCGTIPVKLETYLLSVIIVRQLDLRRSSPELDDHCKFERVILSLPNLTG